MFLLPVAAAGELFMAEGGADSYSELEDAESCAEDEQVVTIYKNCSINMTILFIFLSVFVCISLTVVFGRHYHLT